jgi:hypothetical protein
VEQDAVLALMGRRHLETKTLFEVSVESEYRASATATPNDPGLFGIGFPHILQDTAAAFICT